MCTLYLTRENKEKGILISDLQLNQGKLGVKLEGRVLDDSRPHIE